MRQVNPSGAEHRLSPFNHQLQMYSLAAGAAGVGLLALSAAAHAEIVYTPADVTITAGGVHSYAVDFAGDGVSDLVISAVSRLSIDASGATSKIFARAAQGNGVVGYGHRAGALTAGQTIASARKFKGSSMAFLHTLADSIASLGGQWANVKNRYLGVQFQMSGQTHYGWVRLSVVGSQRPLSAKLTGYAYETEANTAIIAGKISGTDDASLAPVVEPAMKTAPVTLGALALGAPAIEFWRRRETVIAAAN